MSVGALKKPLHAERRIAIFCGDCRDILASFRENAVDAIVTDPPYGVGFMDQERDRFAVGLPNAKAWVGRRADTGVELGSRRKDDAPGAHFPGGLYGGRNVFKRCRKCGKREFSGSPCRCPKKDWQYEAPVSAPVSSIIYQRWCEEWARELIRVLKPGAHLIAFGGERTYHRMACAVEDAGLEIRFMLLWLQGQGFPKSLNLDGKWSGWGTTLKPAATPILLARKPLSEPNVAANVLRWGTGALNIDACRISGLKGDGTWGSRNMIVSPERRFNASPEYRSKAHARGRWPASLILDEEAAAVLDEQSGGRPNPGSPDLHDAYPSTGITGWKDGGAAQGPLYSDVGGASRFFYIAKADAEDRDGTRHPTVKPVDLMKWLVRLVMPSRGLVVDPFMGSGPTIYAAKELGFRAIGIEKEEEYCRNAARRLRQGVLSL